MMWSKLATLGFFMKNIFSNEANDVLISVYDITNKLLSCDLNYIVDGHVTKAW